MASATYLYVLLPAGHHPDRNGLPADVETLLAEVPRTALGGGNGYEQQEDGRWWFNKTITSHDRLDIAEALADRLREVGYRAVVRTRR